ncbi:MAG: Asp-tRNA(Asn)/Glu-tRNA(Gln) amidotransferase subunit GatC [Planctomycetes bacterium]|nr:Asp-tRNA(Asn)/Glu-tRNA(Gln) amidotransferase subunit GatC [Planctomycetota bacterium]
MADADEIRHVAQLARIEVPDARLPLYAAQIARIIDFVAQLDELDTDQVPVMMHASADEDVFREDQPGNCLDRSVALRAARDHDDEQIRVPKTL